MNQGYSSDQNIATLIIEDSEIMHNISNVGNGGGIAIAGRHV